MKSRKNVQKEVQGAKEVYFYLLKNWVQDAQNGKIDFRLRHHSYITIYYKAFNLKNRLLNK
jgi:hypothetical protein